MKVGVISDSHDHLTRINEALEKLTAAGAEQIIHCGDLVSPFAAKAMAQFDGRLHIIYGNNDGELAGLKKILPQIKDGPVRIKIGACRIYVAHFIEELPRTLFDEADVICSGHTHRVSCKVMDRTLLLNPGECCGWVTGRATCAILDTETRTAEIIMLK